MSILPTLGLVLLLGLSGGLISRRLGFPSITGYLVVGIVIGPAVTGAVPEDILSSLEPITGIALAVIAYLIGSSLHTSSLRAMGRSISWITLMQAFGALFAVTVVLTLVLALVVPGHTFIEFYLPLALLLGAASTTTAPAAVLAIIREYKSKGPLTSILLAVVALDDALAVILFSIAVAVSGVLVGTAAIVSPSSAVVSPVLHLLGAVGLGAFCAGLMLLLVRLVHSRELVLVLVLGAVVICYGVAETVGASGVIAGMTLGLIVGNRRGTGQLVGSVEEVQAVLFTMFFVLAGMHFDPGALAAAGPLAVVLVVTRGIGKYMGARLGAVIGKAPAGVGANLGLALLPQAGVAIGLILSAASSFPDLASVMVSATLASVIINEVITPPLAKKALVRAGEARGDGKDEAA